MAKRIAALGAALVVLGAFGGGPARAETVVEKPETFLGSAAGTALDLSVLGNQATFGLTKVEGTSALTAAANGAGQLLVPGTETEAKVNGLDQTSDSGEKCAAPVLPAEITDTVGIAIEVACSSSSASTAGGVPTATSNASVADLDVSANVLLDTLGLGDPINDATGQIIDALEPLLGQFDGTPVEGPIDTVSELLNDVIETQTLHVSAGASLSKVTSTAETITSTATAQGAVVQVLPTGAIDPATLEQGPVLTVEVGAASATAAYNRLTGESSSSFDPALVRVTVDKTVAAGLGLGDGSEDFVVEVAPGQDQTIELPGVGVVARIVAASGEEFTNEDGSVGARADAVRVEVLPAVNGGIVLLLAHAEAAVAGTPLVAKEVSPPVELPRTGGTAFLPVAGLGLLGLAVASRRFARRAS